MSSCRNYLPFIARFIINRMKNILLKRKYLFLISLLVLLLDQSTKIWASQVVSEKFSITLIPLLINLHLVKNTGAAFSLFTEGTVFLSILSLSVSVGIVLWISKNRFFPLWKGLGISFLLGGCMGNGLDRLRLGYVIDFIELIPINFPIFNCADIAINVAVFCLIIDTVIINDQKQRT